MIYCIVRMFFGSSVGGAVVNAALGFNYFTVGKSFGLAKEYHVSFNTGNPLGYASSWPLFALSHHFVVWLALKTWKAYPGIRFQDYALLGDDIVIADVAVAAEYKNILKGLDVEISKPKSLISHTGALLIELFAKKYFVKGGAVDLSPVSSKLSGSRALIPCSTSSKLGGSPGAMKWGCFLCLSYVSAWLRSVDFVLSVPNLSDCSLGSIKLRP